MTTMLSHSNKLFLARLTFALTISLVMTTFAAWILLGQLVTTGNLISAIFGSFGLLVIFLVFLYLGWEMAKFVHMG